MGRIRVSKFPNISTNAIFLLTDREDSASMPWEVRNGKAEGYLILKLMAFQATSVKII